MIRTTIRTAIRTTMASGGDCMHYPCWGVLIVLVYTLQKKVVKSFCTGPTIFFLSRLGTIEEGSKVFQSSTQYGINSRVYQDDFTFKVRFLSEKERSNSEEEEI